MLNVGGWELMVILLVALVVLGPERLPSVARQVGQTVSSLRSMASGFQAEIDAATKAATDSSMTLDGPTNQSEAISATQDLATGAAVLAGNEPPGNEPATAPAASDESAVNAAAAQAEADAAADPFDMAAKARRAQQDHDRADKPVSDGGPLDLRDEEE